MIQQIIDSIVAGAGKAQFVSFTYKTKEKLNKSNEVVSGGEISRFTLILGAKYINLLEKSLLELSLLGEIKTEFPKSLMTEAKKEVFESLTKSLQSHKNGTQSEDYTKKGLYQHLENGLSLNSTDNSLQMFGLIQSKVILKPGIFKQVNSAPLTLAKNLIKKELSISKFREFALDLGNIQIVKMNGETLEIEEKDFNLNEIKQKYLINQPEIAPKV